MPVYRIRMRHRARVTSSAEFEITAASDEAAAQAVMDAYKVSLAKDSPVISLPDGQSALLEPRDVTFLDLTFVAVDDSGGESRPIDLRSSHFN